MSAAKNLLCPFHCKPRLSEVSLESPGLQYISQVPENREDVGQNHDLRKVVSVTLSCLRVKWGYILGKKPENERSKSLAVFISVQTKAIRS